MVRFSSTLGSMGKSFQDPFIIYQLNLHIIGGVKFEEYFGHWAHLGTVKHQALIGSWYMYRTPVGTCCHQQAVGTTEQQAAGTSTRH